MKINYYFLVSLQQFKKKKVVSMFRYAAGWKDCHHYNFIVYSHRSVVSWRWLTSLRIYTRIKIKREPGKNTNQKFFFTPYIFIGSSSRIYIPFKMSNYDSKIALQQSRFKLIKQAGDLGFDDDGSEFTRKLVNIQLEMLEQNWSRFQKEHENLCHSTSDVLSDH